MKFIFSLVFILSAILVSANAKITFFTNENRTAQPFFEISNNRDFLYNVSEPYNITGIFVMPVWIAEPFGKCKVYSFFPSIKQIFNVTKTIPPLIIYNPLLFALAGGCLYQSYAMRAIDTALSNLWNLPDMPNNSSFTVPLVSIPGSSVSHTMAASVRTSDVASTNISNITYPYPYQAQKVVCISVSAQRYSKNTAFGGVYGELYGFTMPDQLKAQSNMIHWTLTAFDTSADLGVALTVARNNSGRGLTSYVTVTAVSEPNEWNTVMGATWHKAFVFTVGVLYVITVIYAVVELTRILCANPKFNLRVFIYLVSIFFLSVTSFLIFTIWKYTPFVVVNTLYWLTWPAGSMAYSALLIKWADTIKKVPHLSDKLFLVPDSADSCLPTSASAPPSFGKMSLLGLRLKRYFNTCRKAVVRFARSDKFYSIMALLAPVIFTATGIVMLVGILGWNGPDATFAEMKRKSDILNVGVIIIRYVWSVFLLLQSILFFYYGTRIMRNLNMVRNVSNRSMIRRMTILTFISSIGWFIALVTVIILANERVSRSVPGYFIIEAFKLINGWILFGCIVLALNLKTSSKVSNSGLTPTSAKSPTSAGIASLTGKFGKKQKKVSPLPDIDTGRHAMASEELVQSNSVVSTPTTFVEPGTNSYANSIRSIPPSVSDTLAPIPGIETTQVNARSARPIGLSIKTYLTNVNDGPKSDDNIVTPALPTPLITKLVTKLSNPFDFKKDNGMERASYLPSSPTSPVAGQNFNFPPHTPVTEMGNASCRSTLATLKSAASCPATPEHPVLPPVSSEPRVTFKDSDSDDIDFNSIMRSVN